MKLSVTHKISIYIIVFVLFSFSFFSCKSSFNLTGGNSDNSQLTEKQEMEYSFYLIEGNKLKTLGYLNEAINSFTKCLDINPGAGAANYELANIYVFKKEFNRALIYSENAIKFSSDNIWYNLLHANILNATGDSKQAIKIYEKIIDNNPDNQDLVIDLANFYSNDKKNYQKAIVLLNSLESKYGVSEELFFEKERIYRKHNIKGKIIPEIKKLVDAYPNNPIYLGLYAERLMNEGKVEESFSVYEKLLEIDPDNPTTHISLGEYYLKIGSVEKAISEFKQSVGNRTLNSDIKINLILNLSGYYGDKISTDKIEELVDLFIDIHPNIADGHALKAEILLSRGDIKRGGDELIKVLEFDKENYLIWEQLITVDSELSRFEEMYQHSKEAISYFPNYPKFLLFNGFSCSMLKKYKEGINILNIGMDMVIGQPELKVQFLTSLADLYYKSNQFEKAFKNFDKALAIEPTNAGILNNYSYYLAIQNINVVKAVDMAKLAVEISPGSGTYLDTYAWALYRSGKYSEAEIIILKAINLDKANNSVIIEHYGDILFKLGRKEEAVINWTKAAELGKGSEYLEIKISSGELVE